MPILIQLFYHGQKKWDLPLSFFESLDLDDEDKEVFRGKVLDFQYQLVDLCSEEYTRLNLSLELRSILYVLKNIWRLHKAEYIRSFFHEFLSKLRYLDPELWKKIVDYWMGAARLKSGKELLKHIPKKEENIMKSVMTQLLEKGRAEEKTEVAKTMLSKGFSLSDITEVAGLSEAEIRKLKSEVDKD